jgi:hypothetical protein
VEHLIFTSWSALTTWLRLIDALKRDAWNRNTSARFKSGRRPQSFQQVAMLQVASRARRKRECLTGILLHSARSSI